MADERMMTIRSGMMLQIVQRNPRIDEAHKPAEGRADNRGEQRFEHGEHMPSIEAAREASIFAEFESSCRQSDKCVISPLPI